MARTVRICGWSLVAAGVLVLLYIVYLLVFTTLVASRAQDDLLEQWSRDHGQPLAAASEKSAPAMADPAPGGPVDPAAGFALLSFERPATGDTIVNAEPLVVVEGVAVADLRRGPGHYPATAEPGDAGNFAVAGHRTTYGAPFADLDEVHAGDEVHVVDRDGDEWVYEVVDTQIVAPDDVWVVGEDPIASDRPLMTLTTCHPRFSDAQRLVVFAELQEQAA